jgi:signal transduction histidine kinase
MGRLTFGARLMLASTLIVAVAVAVLGTVAFVTVRVALGNALENRLDTTAYAIRSVVDIRHDRMQPLGTDDREQFLTVLGQRTDGVVLNQDGRLIASNLAAPPPAVLATLARPGARHGNLRLPSGVVAYAVLPVIERGVRYGTVAAWESRSASDDAVSIMLAALGLAGAIVIALAALVGRSIARRMLRPVAELSSMLSEIEAADLTERLSWSGPDDEIGRLCRTFDRLLDRLQNAFERERRFIADASHELRTPVSVMRAEVELALMHDRAPDAYRAALARLQRETQRLETLAERLLLTARNDATSIEASPVALHEAAQRAIDRMRPLALSRAVTLDGSFTNAVEILADSTTIESAVVALIDNALRFAPRGGRIAVDVSAAGTDAILTVADDGPGFSAAALDQATRRFWRDDPARSGAGTGLGLSIVRSIVERYHGTIELRNAPGGGAIVRWCMPQLRAGTTGIKKT